MRHDVGDDDVGFDLSYCGICHTDLHFINNDLGATTYPLVSGHELAGVVNEVGKNVTKFKVGDKVGVGCMVCLLYTSPSPRDRSLSRMPSSA